jgi:hypothetical protein
MHRGRAAGRSLLARAAATLTQLQVIANQRRPRMLDRADCPNQVAGVTPFRPPTTAEQQTLRWCTDSAYTNP